MSTVHWLPEAQKDLQRLYDFINPHSSNAAKEAVGTILEATDYLEAYPEAGKPWAHDSYYREWSVKFGSRGYVIRYRIYEKKIIIVRIWHGLEER